MKTLTESLRHNLKRIMLVSITVVMISAGVVLLAQTTSSQPSPGAGLDRGNLRAFVELARADLKTQKAIILAQNMELTEAEGAEFWPLQRDYQHELAKLDDQRLANLQNYVANYERMTDQRAAELATRSFELEKKRTDLKRKYFKKMVKVMSAKKVVRFFQLDNQLNMAVELQVAAALPLIK